jgi:site-specific DNA recombinase
MATKHRSKPGDDDQVLVPAVAYVRCSTDGQIEASIPAQRAAIEQWASANGYRILRFYVDEGISGWKEERAGFQALMSDLDKRGDFRAVLCWHTNRFSRFPVLEANHYWYLLDKAGVHLATVCQGRQDWQDIGSWLKASIEQHGDAQHRFKLSADVRRGKRAVAERGDWQGPVPFGYVVNKENRRLELANPLEVELVRRMFREYLEGRSLRSIALRFNDEGLASLNGGRLWYATGIRVKLRNPAYVGVHRWGDVEHRDHHPAIIPIADFERVQSLLNERKGSTTPLKDGGGFLLTGLLRCGKCGSRMTGIEKSHLYECCGARDKGPHRCDGSIVKQRELVGYVVDTIETHWMNPKTVARLRKALHDLVDAETPKVDAKQMERQLAAIATKLDKAKRRLLEVPADMIAVVSEAIRELRIQQEQIESALKTASKPRGALYVDADERIDAAVSRFTQLRQVLGRADEIQQREVIRQTVQTLEVWSNRVPNEEKSRFELERGEIVLRSDNLFTTPACRFCRENRAASARVQFPAAGALR